MVRVYVDGGAASEKPQLGPMIDSPDMALILDNSFNAQRQFQGYIDEVRVWSRALDINEINVQMNMKTSDVVSSVAPHSKLTTTWSQIKRY